MLETFRKLWKIKDLQKKVLYTFLMLLIYRLVGVIPAPGIDVSRLNESNNFMQLPLLNMMQMMKAVDLRPLTGDPDFDFAQLMIDHHQAAIENSDALLKYGRENTTKALAQQIITDQKMEIKMLQDWLLALLSQPLTLDGTDTVVLAQLTQYQPELEFWFEEAVEIESASFCPRPRKFVSENPRFTPVPLATE